MRYLEIDPARAKAVKDSKVQELLDDPTYIGEKKLDGWRFLMHFGSDLERVFMTGRRYSRVTGRLSEKGLCAPQLWPLSDAASLGYTVLDGEVVAPGEALYDVAGIMNVDPEDSQKRIAEIGPPIYYAFDCLWLDGQDLREKDLHDRRAHLGEVISSCGHDNLRLLPILPNPREDYETIVAQGGEGIILKDITSTYGESGSWIKVKKWVTLDVVVVGFTEARFGRTGKFDGQIGAVKIAVFSSKGQLIEVGKCSGMDDETRLDMTHNPQKWIGSVIEVRCQEFAKERLRDPRFKRARPDANAADATFAKMMADLDSDRDENKPGQLRLL